MIWGLIGIHFIKFFYWFRELRLSHEFPVVNFDFIQYYARVLRSHEFLEASGRYWGYDPFQMAGYISGPFLAVGTNFLTFSSYILSPIVSVHRSVLLFECLGYLIAPFAVLPFIRFTGGTKIQSWVGFALILLLYGHMEVLSLQLIHIGLWGYQMAGFCSLLQVGYLWKWITEKKTKDYILLVVISALLFQFHSAALLIVFIPNLAIYYYQFQKLKMKDHLKIGAGILLVGFANWYWIYPFLTFSNFMDTAPYFKTTGLPGLYEILSPVQSSWFTFIRMIFSWGLLIFSYQRIKLLIKKKPALGWSLLSWVVVLFIFGYFGSHLPVIKNLQPGRIIFPLWMLLGCLASFSVADKLWSKNKNLTIGIFVSIIVVFLFHPDIGWSYLTNTLTKDQAKVVDYIRTKGPKNGRILMSCSDFDPVHISDIVPALTGRSIIGGPHPGNFIKGRFSLFKEGFRVGHSHEMKDPYAFDRPLRTFTQDQFSNYLNLYNVSLILTNGKQSAKILHQWKDVLQSSGRVGGYNIFVVNQEPSWFLKGSGQVSFDYDQIRIEDASPGVIQLKFHWIKLFVTDPPVKIRPVKMMEDPLPFIEISNTENHKNIQILNKSM